MPDPEPDDELAHGLMRAAEEDADVWFRKLRLSELIPRALSGPGAEAMLTNMLKLAFCAGACHATQQMMLAKMTTEMPADNYFDNSFPERSCNFCHRVYRGPSLYCCRAHAQART